MGRNKIKLDYIPELDGLRGAAILCVMAFHGGRYLMGGFIGVDIFFVLSGFLITTLLVREFDESRSINFKNFYMRRVLRLGPALIAMLAVFCLITFLTLAGDAANRNYIDAIISLFYLTNWARAFSMHPPDLLGHTWSLSIEEQFYIIWPVTLWLVLRVANRRLHAAIIVAAFALASWMLRVYLASEGTSPMRLYNGLDTRADALMVGCFLALILPLMQASPGVRAMLPKVMLVAAPLALLALAVICIYANWRDSRMYYFGFILIEFMAAILILDVLANSQSIVKKLLGMRWLVWIGSLSYGLYLWHYPIYRTMFALGFNRITVIIAGSLLTVFFAAVSYYALEKPVLKLKRHFSQVPSNP